VEMEMDELAHDDASPPPAARRAALAALTRRAGSLRSPEGLAASPLGMS
jgi:hypothetical protein